DVFEEQVEIFKAATSRERFSYRGKHYTIPPEGLTFRGDPVTEFPLVPRPINAPVAIYQPISSEDTLVYAARQRHIGVLANHPWERMVPWWRRYGALVEEFHGVRLRPGEDRMLQAQLHIADSAEAAIRTARCGHDELTKLLWPNIIRRNAALSSRPPFSLEERMAGKSWIVGTPAQARDALLEMQSDLGFEALVISPHLPGMRRAEALEQLGPVWADVALALPPTTFGKSVEHITFPGTLTFSGDTLRLVLRDLAASVARSGFTKLVLLGSHGGNVGTTDDYFRDLRMETDLRVFKIFLGGIAQVPGLVAPEEAAIAMHSGDSETSMLRHLAPGLVHMDRAEGYVFDS